MRSSLDLCLNNFRFFLKSGNWNFNLLVENFQNGIINLLNGIENGVLNLSVANENLFLNLLVRNENWILNLFDKGFIRFLKYFYFLNNQIKTWKSWRFKRLEGSLAFSLHPSCNESSKIQRFHLRNDL